MQHFNLIGLFSFKERKLAKMENDRENTEMEYVCRLIGISVALAFVPL
jgi:hypothetical protein